MLSEPEQIVNNLKHLHMPTIRRSYEEIAEQARADAWSYEQYLFELLNLECEVRRQNRISRNLHTSKLPPSKT
ncbi:MAG: AAA family ATPase, partial [Proteobacteria bacterium]|nr:AAA family ATPase [Pseudomonadota bacterium]